MMDDTAQVGFERLIRIFARGTCEERVSFSRLSPRDRQFFSDQLAAVGRSSNTHTDDIRAHAAISTLVRYLLNIIPPNLFSEISPDFRKLAEQTLQQHVGACRNLDDTSTALVTIFKRIRNYYIKGRVATSLDLGSARHSSLLRAQRGRCNHCLYEFRSDYYRYDSEEDGVPSESYSKREGELSINLYRRPELDHIIPLIFGGDQPENWQILCASCNRGKSDHLSSPFGLNTNKSLRLHDLRELTLGKRYSVIADRRREENVDQLPEDGFSYRIYKRDSRGLLNSDNLYAKYS